MSNYSLYKWRVAVYILFSFTCYMTWPEKLSMHVSSKFSNFGVLWLFELGV